MLNHLYFLPTLFWDYLIHFKCWLLYSVYIYIYIYIYTHTHTYIYIYIYIYITFHLTKTIENGGKSHWNNKCFSQIHVGHKYWYPFKFLWVKYRWSIFTFIFTILITPWWLFFGRISRKKYPCSSKNKLQCIQLSDTTGTSNGTGFFGQIKQKQNCFLAANTQDEFGEHRDKK